MRSMYVHRTYNLHSEQKHSPNNHHFLSNKYHLCFHNLHPLLAIHILPRGFHICQHQLIHFNILLLRLEYSDSCNSNNTCNHRNFHFFVFHCSIV